MKHDIARSITIEQLKQQYQLDNKKMLEAIELERTKLNKLENELNNYIDVVMQDIENLQDQVDGNITTWFYNGVPTLSNSPAVDWVTDDEKNNHLGDLYYDGNTGYAYRFTLENNAYKWLKLTDSDVTEALALANVAKDTADNKRRVFMSQPTPPYDNGDLWINNNEIYICQISKASGESYSSNDFINNLKYTDDTVANQVGGNLTILSGRVTTIEQGVDTISQQVEANKYYEDSQGNKQLISDAMTTVTQTVDGLVTEVNNFDTVLGENYYTKEQNDTLIQNATDGLRNTFTLSGGANLLRNTAPYFMTSSNEAEYWEGNVKRVSENDSTSGYAMSIQNGILKQSVNLVNGTYSLSFKYKRVNNASTCQVRYNGRSIDLDENSGAIHTSGEITTGQMIIEIEANASDNFTIYDLMLKHGAEGEENMLVWTQNANESISDTVQISKGITALSNATDTKATMDSEGFKVKNKTTNVPVMEATSTGGKFLDLTSTGKSNISGLIIEKHDHQVWGTGG